MASMDLDTVIKDLNKRFAEPLPEFYKRRIIFWYDEEREFEDRLDDIQIDNVKLLVLTGSNNFEAKKLLSMDDTDSNYLVYNPLSDKSQENDWLLDIELYSESFRADLISIWMNEMGLPTNPDLRRLVKKYKKFFGAQTRRKAFTKLNKGIVNAAQMHLAVMAAICGVDNLRPNSIMKSVISNGIDMDSNKVSQDFVKYSADEAFWKLAKQATGYSEDDATVEGLVMHILLTATTRTLKAEHLAGLDNFISTSSSPQSWCYDFVSELISGNNKQEVFELLRYVEDKLALRERFKKVPLDDLIETEVFPCIDECILAELMTDIANHIVHVDVIVNTVEKRRTLAWYDFVKYYYDGISEVANMQSFRLQHAQGFHAVDAKEIWKNYTEEYYHMDTFYRQYHLAFRKSLTDGNDYLDDLFKQVTDEFVENIYVHWFLEELGDNWSTVSADDLAQYGYIPGIPQEVDFYDQNIRGKDNRIFVIISDAFRYEVAASLTSQLRSETQSEVELTSFESTFPSITKFGMAALLPHRELSIKEHNGGLQILADGMSTDAGNRDKVLKNTNSNSVALKYKNIETMKRAERSKLVKGMDVVYIYHDRIDEASHTADDMVFSAGETAIKEIKNIIKIIRNEFGGTRIYVTADHGFLYTDKPLTESDKVDKTTLGDQDIEVGRRYLITHKGADPQSLLSVKFMDDNYDAFAPRESIRIKKRGSSSNYVHGGISLQEMVVPLIEYHYLRNASKTYQRDKEKYDTKPVEVELVSASRKISNMIFSLNFYQKDPVSDNRSVANYLLYFVDEDGNRISDTAKIIADKTSENGKERTFRCSFNLKSLKYDNRASYYLVIADETGLQMPQKEEFQIDIAFAVDEFDFFS